MEDILNKNIFNDKQLEKFSPDYVPSDIVLRMEVRDTMVKDAHSHNKCKSGDWQRKTIRRPKDCFKINKEIEKIRNGFQKINLKNQIMLKNAVKYVDTMKAQDFANNFEETVEVLELEAEKYLREIAESHSHLVVSSDNDFKINEKPKSIKLNKESKIPRAKTKRNVNETILKKEDENVTETFNIQDLLRIECTLYTSEPDSEHQDTINDDIKDKEDLKDHSSDYESNMLTLRNNFNNDNVDLESLLVMMAISPKQNEDGNLKSQESSSSQKNENTNNTTTETVLYNISSVVPHTMVTFTDDIDMILNVSAMKIEMSEKQRIIMRKYIDKWKAFVVKRKEQKKEEALNNFFDKLVKKKMDLSHTNTPEPPPNKAKLLAKDCSRYRHRYQVQRQIIALQKAKLEEQNRIIEELKCNRIVEASRLSMDAMKDEVRKTYYGIDKQLKPKIKCLTNDLKIEVEEPSLVLQCLKVPQFLQRMEKRAREREEKHAIIRERRKQMEEERIRLKQQEELARAQMDKEEKLKRMKELKMKRKREKIDNIRKKEHAERIRALTVMADLHYERNLMTKYGIRPFRILIEMKKDNIEKSKAHYKFQLKKNVFLHWMWYTEDMWYERNFKAEDFHRKKLLRKAFEALKKNHQNFVLKKQVADDYYDLYVTNLVFRKFRVALDIIKEENEKKWHKAVHYHNCNVLFRTFSCWRTLPALNELKREQEIRKARWREKVLQVVPDYAPPDD